MLLPVSIIDCAHFLVLMQKTIEGELAAYFRRRSQVSGTVPDIPGGTRYFAMNGFLKGFWKIVPGVIPYALGNAVSSRKPQVFCTVFDIADGGTHAAAGSCVNDDCLLFHERKIRAVNYPAVCNVVKQGFHLSGNMIYISGRTEQNQSGLFHSLKDGSHGGSTLAGLLFSKDAGAASGTDVRHVIREKEGKTGSIFQEFFDEHLCDLVSA